MGPTGCEMSRSRLGGRKLCFFCNLPCQPTEHSEARRGSARLSLIDGKFSKDMRKTEIEAFLSHLATNRKVAASTQRQALNALVFLYKHVLDKPIGGNIAPVKAKKRRRPPVVMHKDRSSPC